jgi:hypothetical protein
MASPTIYGCVTAGEFKTSFSVVEAKGIRSKNHSGYVGNHRFRGIVLLPIGAIDFPARRGVAGSAVYFQIRAVRILRKQARGDDQE